MGWLADLLTKLLGLFSKREITTETAATSEPAAAVTATVQEAATTPETTAVPESVDDIPVGDADVIGIFYKYEPKTGEKQPYTDIDVTKWKVKVAMTGTKAGEVHTLLRIDGDTRDQDGKLFALGHTTIREAEVGQPTFAVLDWPNTSRYQTPGLHTAEVLLGYKDNPGSTVDSIAVTRRAGPYTVNVVRKPAE